MDQTAQTIESAAELVDNLNTQVTQARGNVQQLKDSRTIKGINEAARPFLNAANIATGVPAIAATKVDEFAHRAKQKVNDKVRPGLEQMNKRIVEAFRNRNPAAAEAAINDSLSQTASSRGHQRASAQEP